MVPPEALYSRTELIIDFVIILQIMATKLMENSLLTGFDFTDRIRLSVNFVDLDTF
jgi:hypothetical protein